MTSARMETVYTFDGWTEELERRIKVQSRRIKKRIKRKVLYFLKIIFATFVFYGIFALICYGVSFLF